MLYITWSCLRNVIIYYVSNKTGGGGNLLLYTTINEPHHEKTALKICKNKGADQPRSNLTADQRLYFHDIERTIPLLPKSGISSLEPSSTVVQPGLCRTWSETLKTGFVVTRLILNITI